MIIYKKDIWFQKLTVINMLDKVAADSVYNMQTLSLLYFPSIYLLSGS